MDYFSYPIDTKALLRKKIAIKKELLQQDVSWITKRVAILGGSTTNEIVDQLELALLHYGIRAEFYQSEYGKYWEDGVFGNPTIDCFAPDIVYIHTSWKNIQMFPSMDDNPEDVDIILDSEYDRYLQLWEKLREKFRCPIIQNNFDRPSYRLMGNRDIWDFRGKSNFISRLNQKLYEYAQGQTSFFVNDLDYIAQSYGLTEWSDPLYWNMYKYACPMNAIPYVSQSVANIIKSIFGKNKKLLALDLDNTLWGGVVGDDGVEGIKIGKELPQGQSYYAFQEYCKELQQIGVVLAVASKNDKENAIAGLKHSESVLKPDDFVSIKANWLPKDQNLRDISDEMSLGLDSFVFVDDNPAEREIVSKQLSEVEVPEMSGSEYYIREIDRQGYFEVTEISTEDLRKTDQYKARLFARNAQAAFADYTEYLRSLEMKAVVTDFEPISTGRISQLTNKSNQFNLTTKRCTEDDIRNMQESDDYICLCGRLIDKFGDNGIVTVIAGEIMSDELHIRLWLMSCRVLKRGLEDAMMNVFVEQAKDKSIKKIVGYYYPTPKNSMVKGFYEDMGFSKINEDLNETTTWEMPICRYTVRSNEIKISK